MLTVLAFVLATAAAPAPHGAIDASIRGTNEPLVVALLSRGDEERWHVVTERTLASSTRHVRFEDLEPGVYQILLRGEHPSEQLGTQVILGANETRREQINVTPLDLAGRVFLGDAPLPNATIVIGHRELKWRGMLRADASGAFHDHVWQRGPFTISVKAKALAIPYVDIVEWKGASPLKWDVRVPHRRIAGVVHDAKSGTPIAGAWIHIESTKEGETHLARTTTDANGRFDIDGRSPGMNTLEISATNHLDAAPIKIDLTEKDSLREVDARLDPGISTLLQLNDTKGQPIANAEVVATISSTIRSRAWSNDLGITRLPIPSEKEAMVYVIPADGSFAVAKVRANEAGRQRITVATPASSLRIVTRRTDGKPIPPIDLLMRFNGAIIPPSIAAELLGMQGLKLATDGHGEALLRNLPAGSYEFWPYRGEGESEAILATADSIAAPIQVDVHTGENSIAVNFRAR